MSVLARSENKNRTYLRTKNSLHSLLITTEEPVSYLGVLTAQKGKKTDTILEEKYHNQQALKIYALWIEWLMRPLAHRIKRNLQLFLFIIILKRTELSCFIQ